MPSPQDSSNSGNENMYTLMKSVPGGTMPGDFSMGGDPDPIGPNTMGPIGPNTMGPVMNEGLDGMKNSPVDGGPGEFHLSGFTQR